MSALAPRWVEGRDYVLATRTVRERLQRVVKPEVFRRRWLPWEEPAEWLARREEIGSLRLMAASDEDAPFPAAVHELEQLRHIGMPLRYAEIAHPVAWSNRLESLDLNEQESGQAHLPGAARFPRLRELSCVNGTLGFHADAFPDLESVRLHLSRGAELPQLLSSRSLRHAFFTGAHSLDELRMPDPQSLLSFGLGNSPLAELTGIGRFDGVRRIVIKSLPKLTSLAWVSELPDLEELELLYCPRLADEKPLLALPRLRTVLAVACPQLDLSQWRRRPTPPTPRQTGATNQTHDTQPARPGETSR